MKKLLLSLLAVFSATMSITAAEEPVYTCLFGKDYNEKEISSYTDSWYAQNGSYKWNITNANNNKNSWNYIKFGSKSNASTGTITTDFAAPDAVNKVVVEVGAVTVKSINSITLQVSSSTDFSSSPTISYDGTLAKGDLVFNISDPQKDRYYKLTFNCAKASSNGPIQVNSVKYYAVEDTGDKTEATLSWSKESDTIKFGEAFVAPTLTKSADDVIVSYSSDNKALLDVDAVTGVMTFTPNVAGTATVTASIASLDTKYFATPATYTLTVVDPNAPFEFTSALGQEFTFENPADLAIWSLDSKYGLKGTAYINGATNAAEAIAASPLLDLTRYKDITLDFQNAFNNYKKGSEYIAVEDFAGYAYVVVKEEGETEWTEICEATAPTSFSWTFFDNAQIDLSAYSNKKIQFGFKYVSTAEVAGTWEIKNIELRGVVGQAKAPAGLSFGEQTEFTVEEGGDFTAPELINPNGLNVTITSSDEDVAYAEFDGEDLIVIIGKHGTATITATSEETDQFAAGKAGFTITVTEKQKTPVTLSFDKAEFSGYAGEIFEAGLPVLTKTANVEVIYTSSDENVVEIDSEGTILNLVAAGTATITASFDGNDTYNSASASYTVTVLPGLGDITVNGKVVKAEETITLFEGENVVIAAENATAIEVLYMNEAGDTETLSADSSCNWTATLGEYIFEVSASLSTLSKAVNFNISVEEAPEISTTTLKPSDFGIEGTSYTVYTATIDGITYNGKINGGNGYLGIKGSNGGIAVTANDSKVCTAVTVTQYASQGTDKERKAAVYGSYEAFETGEGLASSSLEEMGAVKLGEAVMKKGEAVKIDLDENAPYYPYIIIISATNASDVLQISNIDIEWTKRFETPLVEHVHTGKLSEGGYVTFTLNHSKGPKARIFYQYESNNAAAAIKGLRVPSLSANTWTEASFDDNEIRIDAEGKFHVHASDATGKNRSAVLTATVSDEVTTSIEEISDAAATSAAEIFDLQGRRVTTAPRRGLYIIKQGSKVSKRAL